MSDEFVGLVADNALIDAEQMARSIDRKFVDADIAQAMQDNGIDLHLGACVFVHRYEGTNSFVNDVLKRRLSRYKKLTSGQARAGLNIMQQEMGLTFGESKQIACFNCDEKFSSWDDLQEHKRTAHGSKHHAPPVVAEVGEAAPVIANTTATKGLDLTNLPDGRYAAPDRSGNNDYIFIMVKRVQRTHNRDRRYVYGKIVTGNEVVVAGTIEVKLWSSDSKELVGEQKPGDVYRGDLEEDLELIMLSPEVWAILFGKICGHCCICGKTLTDEVSRAIGMGLECETKTNYFKNKPKYTYVGSDRPNPEKADPNDQKYLDGTLRRYIKPPEVKPQQVVSL